MLLPPLEILEPTSMARLRKILADHGTRAKIIAGGTDIVPDLKREEDRRRRFPELPPLRPGEFPEKLVSIARINELHGMLFPRTGAVRIGTLTTMAELAKDNRVNKKLSALSDGAASVGSPQVRNRATLGGNLCNARPAADTAPPVIALGGTLEIEDSNGQKRMVSAATFFKGPGETVLERDEIVVAVHFPKRTRRQGSAFEKLCTRKVYEIAIVSAAAALDVDDDGIREARIVLGSVGPTPIDAVSAAAHLVHKPPTEKVFEKAAKLAMEETSPITDHRASRGYRARMVQVMTFRALRTAFARFSSRDGEGAS